MDWYALAAIVLILAIILAACSSVVVKKTPFLESDNVNGIPFFLGRPCVAVKKPFVVNSKTSFLNGLIDPTGEFVYVEEVPEELQAEKLFKRGQRLSVAELTTMNQDEDFSDGMKEKAEAESVDQEDNPENNGQNSQNAGQSDDIQNEKEEKGEKGGTTEIQGNGENDIDKKTGASVSVSVKNGLNNILPVNQYYDVIYIQDPDLYYVAKKRAGIGFVKMSLQQGPGGVLQGFNSEVDNDAISGILKNLLDKFSSKAIESFIKPKPGTATEGKPAGTKAVREGVDQQDLEIDEMRAAGYKPVTLNVQIIDVVPTAIYPINWKTELSKEEVQYNDNDQKNRFIIPIISKDGREHPYIVFKTYPLMRIKLLKAISGQPSDFQQ